MVNPLHKRFMASDTFKPSIQQRARESDSTQYDEQTLDDWRNIVADPTKIDNSPGDANATTYGFSYPPPMAYLEKLKIPVLFTYGTKDYGSPFNDYFRTRIIEQKKTNFAFRAYIGVEHNFFPVKRNMPKLETYIPCDTLKPFIRTFIVQESAEASTYKVLPDTGVAIGFQYKGRLSRLDDGAESPLSISGISGLSDHSRTFRNSPDIGTILVLFKEAGAAPFFQQPIHELFRESVSLDNFMLRSELLSLEEQLAEATEDVKRISAVEQFLINRMSTAEPDKLVLAALAIIHKARGDIRIKDLIEQLHVSQSPLEKRFRQAVGTSPKKYASIVRMKNVIKQYSPANSLTDLAYEGGFYDQAHFIKEFKIFTGDTPGKFFKDN